MGISNMQSYISTEKSHVVWNYKKLSSNMRVCYCRILNFAESDFNIAWLAERMQSHKKGSAHRWCVGVQRMWSPSENFGGKLYSENVEDQCTSP